jgi:hypothetical protein
VGLLLDSDALQIYPPLGEIGKHLPQDLWQ